MRESCIKTLTVASTITTCRATLLGVGVGITSVSSEKPSAMTIILRIESSRQLADMWSKQGERVLDPVSNVAWGETLTRTGYAVS